jgi:hypothetical protein
MHRRKSVWLATLGAVAVAAAVVPTLSPAGHSTESPYVTLEPGVTGELHAFM